VTPLTLALYLVLAPAIGATGAAFGSTISYAITTIVSLVYVRRVTVIPFRALAVRVATDLQDHAQALRRVRRLPVQRLRPLP
jgi:Na+-driven multidrug efflux pump